MFVTLKITVAGFDNDFRDNTNLNSVAVTRIVTVVAEAEELDGEWIAEMANGAAIPAAARERSASAKRTRFKSEPPLKDPNESGLPQATRAKTRALVRTP